MSESRPRCVFIVGGSIAAYKAPIIIRGLLERGVDVHPVMTRSAQQFLGAPTLSGLTGHRVLVEMFDNAVVGELHVELASQADVLVVAPATADFLARLAQGRADDLATATLLCSRRPAIVAPAMHPRMWDHPATQRNVATLLADGLIELVGPEHGPVASGDIGLGRLADPARIVESVMAAIAASRSAEKPASDLAGRHVVVSAGPTVEDLDPVRFLSNRSTGKMGFAVASRAAARGARVTLVAGPVALETPRGVKRVDVRGALEMRAALWQATGTELELADAIVMTAAVADYRPANPAPEKHKRVGDPAPIELLANPDLIAEIGAARNQRRPILVAFAVETLDDAGLIASAQKKLAVKKVDFVVANHASESFGRDDNRAALVTETQAAFIGPVPKHDLADKILDRIVSLLSQP